MRYNPLNGGNAFPNVSVCIHRLPQAFTGQTYAAPKA
jgi:gentisate 1,2-dioxygenase